MNTEYRFDVGDKVRVCVDPANHPSVGALEHNGEVMTIKELCSFVNAYKTEEYPDQWWSDGCFEKAE